MIDSLASAWPLMSALDDTPIDGIWWRTIVIGLGCGALGWWLMSAWFAWSILMGTAVSAFNLRAMAWMGRKMLTPGPDGPAGSKVWATLLGFKLLMMMGLTLIFVVVVDADVVGYVIGYSAFLPAIVWSLTPYLLDEQATDKEGDTESL